jgi:hypothetical protein
MAYVAPPPRLARHWRLWQIFFSDAKTGTIRKSSDGTLATTQTLYRRWGIKTAREYARIKIGGLRLVSGNPDFANAPAHGHDDARFYDRQQDYGHARGR